MPSSPQLDIEPRRDPKFFTRILVLVLLVALFVWAYFFIPSLKSRLSWEADKASTYLRGVVDPAGPLPTPKSRAQAKMLPEGFTPQGALTSASATPESTSTPAAPQPPIAVPTSLPAQVALPAPQWEKQEVNNCGPATLTMYLRYYGWSGNQDDISSMIRPDPGDRNVNVEELIYYTRTKAGWLNTQYRVGGTIPLLKGLLAAGYPVMVEKGLAMKEDYWPDDDRWAGHYALVTGYDDREQKFIVQDAFDGPDQKVDYQYLDQNWKAFNRVYILVYPPESEAEIQSILSPDWNSDTNREHALAVAQAEAEKNPQDAFAWFNQGTNLVYFERYAEAVKAYDTARSLPLPQRMLRYQFGPFIAYFNTGQIDELLALVDYALKRTPNSEEALLWKGWAMTRKGYRDEAEKDFRAALKINPNYQDAKYALDYLSNKP